MTFLSVAVCTHNPRPNYLDRALGSLRTQTLSQGQWELLMIDNASTDRLADRWDLGWHANARHIREDQPGLTPARLRAIAESKGELLVFVDDDNVLFPDFLENAKYLATIYPYLGVFGAGVLEPEFEVSPPAELNPYLSLLALRRVPTARWTNNTEDFDCTPWGAGLCVTRPVAGHYHKLVARLNANSVLGRRRQQLFCGEDDVFSWAAAASGLGFGIFPELRITHLISAERLSQAYFIRLLRAHAFSHGVLDFLRDGARRPGFDPLQYPRLLLHGMKNGLFAMRCRRAAMRGRDDANQFIAERKLQPLDLFTVPMRNWNSHCG
ncbi:MAG TPA: glycosyltransferase [Candidatus Sulfopaludibacter sp.]|nr:glycosyltransferase [Candidatus Sulfopaludibacter sp.]